MNRDKFIKEIEKLNIKYDEKKLNDLEIYCDYLLEYNVHTNLTAIKTKEEVYLKHFYDSLTICKSIDLNKIDTILDIGSGAGFPGIVLKIFYPHLNMTLIDSNNKKTKFLNSVVDKLGLINIIVVNNRVEKFALNNLNKFDLVTGRAVTSMPILTELSLPLVKVNGLFIAMKGKVKEELELAMDAIEIMGGKLINVEYFELENNQGDRSLVKIEKLRNTECKEIRPYEKIIKKPLQKRCK